MGKLDGKGILLVIIVIFSCMALHGIVKILADLDLRTACFEQTKSVECLK